MIAPSIAAFLLAANAAPVPTVEAAPAGPILLDGRCDDDDWKRATRTTLGHGYTLLAQASPISVCLCIVGPASSYNTLDIYLVDAEERVVDLHVSAQVGQRYRGADGSWPEYVWGNHVGWYGVAVPFTGFEGEGAARRAAFKRGTAREIEIRHDAFRDLPWRFRVESRGHEEADGVPASVVYPAGVDPDARVTWATLALAAREAAHD